MFLLVRTKDQLNKTKRFFENSAFKVETFAISSTKLQKIDIQPDDDGFIVTSPNAILAIPQTKLPFFCVGAATEQEAQETGRRIAYVGHAGAEDLAKDVARRFPPEHLVHAAGDTADTSWYKILEDAGISVEKRQAYTTEYASNLDDVTKNILQNGHLKAIVFFSVQGAENFTKILLEAGFKVENFSVITFSKNIADVCSEYGQTYITEAPSLEAVKNIMKAL